MRFNQIIQPRTLDEAFEALNHHKDAVILGGGAFLKLQNRSVPAVIDLSLLHLDKIEESTGMVTIDPMVTLRQFETHQALPEALRSSVQHVAGVAVRNVATIGGTVAGRYPFSDVLTALLALGAHLEFYEAGHLSLEEYLEGPPLTRDILTRIVVPQVSRSVFKSICRTYTDFPTVNLAIAHNHEIRIAVGARPSVATLIRHPDLSRSPAQILSKVEFQDDFRASAPYRRKLAETLLEDLLEEVRTWK